ncbi:hypothetical protein CQA53_03875 [Helicobacter didelphidarum]|uniref:UDP-4-amino-4, 6-dideoxy-N-acetyl-beta-L-altrosamine N-acetyltransferase n=1 Tax=Helicobacter didelphidarum TaxID=2040648 RepID=A0A3D8IMA8_9HELI|nr:GNAT family N-acetyltransferase [Helicobacter didelphidarum]RDU66368.1 hypothetical protein CQA53_03875 [Helicobacter didelphidarum]
MKIRILTENIQGLGLGHIARSFNLALIFLEMGYEVDFFVRGSISFLDFLKKQEIAPNLVANFYPLHIEWLKLCHTGFLECNICIIDSYQVEDFSLFLKHSNVLCLLDDDGRHFQLLKNNRKSFLQDSSKYDTQHSQINQKTTQTCNMMRNKPTKLFVLNPNGYYRTLHVEPDLCDYIFSGLEYAPINPCFRNKNLFQKEKTYDFFVCLGGEDLQDKSYEIFMQLQSFRKSAIVVVGTNYRGKLLDSEFLCKDTAEHIEQYRIFHNISQHEIAYLIASAKSCIVSGGGIIFEALSLCDNIFTINLASNQNEQIALLSEQGLVCEISLPLTQASLNMQNNKRHMQNKVGVSLWDFASNLILHAINTTLQRTQESVKNFHIDSLYAVDFCNISANEVLNVLEYRNHEFVRKNMYGSSKISLDGHLNFIKSLQQDKQNKYFLVQEHGLDIGVISLIRINLKHSHAYLGIYKNPLIHTQKNRENNTLLPCNTSAKTSQSYGTKLMKVIKHIAFQEYNLNMLYLEVVETNMRAIQLYKQEGFEYLGTLKEGFRVYEKQHEHFLNILLYGLKNPTRECKK